MINKKKKLPHSFVNFDELPNSAYVRIKTIAMLLDCSEVTVWRMIKDGRLPPVVKLSNNISALNVGQFRAVSRNKI